MKTDPTHNCRDDEKLAADVQEFGHHVIMVEANEYLPSFAYSIGLWKTYRHPEIICFGMNVGTLGGLINLAGELVRNGQALQTNRGYDDFFEGGTARFLEVDKRSFNDYFGAALDFYDSEDFPALQLVWPDREDKFPWEDEFNEELADRQPLLDRNADFKFREARNLGVITTSQWVEESKPIVHVLHYTDGDWCFLTDDDCAPENLELVCLEEMVSLDKTLNDVFNLDYGEQAEREFVGDKWTRSEFEYEDEDSESVVDYD